MIFTSPLGLLALLGIPAIVVIHLFRRRFPPASGRRTVSLADRSANTSRRRKDQQASHHGQPDSRMPRGTRAGSDSRRRSHQPGKRQRTSRGSAGRLGVDVGVDAQNESPRDRAVQRVHGRDRTSWPRRSRDARPERRSAGRAGGPGGARRRSQAGSRKMEAAGAASFAGAGACGWLASSRKNRDGSSC